MSAENPSDDFDGVVEQSHLALDAIAKGNHVPFKNLYSQRDDVTLGNPFGPFVRGFEQVVETMQRAASYYRDGEASGFEQVSKHVSDHLAYVVEVERFNSKVGGAEEVTPISLRCSSIFRREDGAWRLVHRHADPITTARPPESVVAT
ncbi:MAG: nuclear transport factor 2 family protein [Actinomycetota bacterium]